MEKIDAEIAYLRIGLEKTAGDRELEAWSWLMQVIDAHKVHKSSSDTEITTEHPKEQTL